MATTPPFFLALETKPVEPSEYRWEAVVGPPFGCASPAAHAELLRVRRGVRAALPREPEPSVDKGVATVTIRWPQPERGPRIAVTRRFYLHWKLQSVIDFIGSEPACPVKWALARADVSPPTQFKTEHASERLSALGVPEHGLVLLVGTPSRRGSAK